MNQVFVLVKHFREAGWVELQRPYLDRYLTVPHTKLFAMEGLDRSSFRPDEVIVDVPLSPTEVAILSTDRLADVALESASDDDWLLFLDSDAFPLADIRPLLETGSNLVAIQRRELGDFHPHPSFTLVRAGLWRDLKGTWVEGTWRTSGGQDVTEMGGTLLSILRENAVDWTKLTRVNTRGFHPLWFGVYGLEGRAPFAYHHGAGSRVRVSRKDDPGRRLRWLRSVERTRWALSEDRAKKLGLSLPDCWKARPERINEAVWASMTQDEEFWRVLL